jgi:CBS domain-containing protein
MVIAKDLMKKPITISNSENISDAIAKLFQNKISRLLIEKNGKISEIVTEKDIVFFLLQSKAEKNLDKIPISEVAKKLVTVESSKSIKDSANLMLDKKISSLAVGSNGQIDGIFTKTDLTRFYSENFIGKKKVSDYMTTSYTWMFSDDSIHKVVSKMIDKKISRIILISSSHKPYGILSLRDLLKISRDLGNEETVVDNTTPGVPILFTRKGFLSETGFGGVTKSDQIMKNKIISVNQDEDLATACNVLLKNKINGLGVLSNDGTLAGILSKTDVTLAIATMK